jgi:bifunctional non-homologous end joining protein LigD
MGEKNRIGKIFIDYMRNRQQASTVVPYSVRAKPGLPVATPIAWEELKDTTGSAMWTVTSLAKRLSQLAKDPWEDYFKTKQMLTGGMKRKIGAGTE